MRPTQTVSVFQVREADLNLKYRLISHLGFGYLWNCLSKSVNVIMAAPNPSLSEVGIQHILKYIHILAVFWLKWGELFITTHLCGLSVPLF